MRAQLKLVQDGVSVLVKACGAVRDVIPKIDPVGGADIWNAIVDFVDRNVARGVTTLAPNNPGNRKVQKIWNRFKPQKIPR